VFSSKLQKCLKGWIKSGGDLGARLYEGGTMTVATARDANVICHTLKHVISSLPSESETKQMVSTPLQVVTGLFQDVQSEAAYLTLSHKGLPLLHFMVQDGLHGDHYVPDEDMLFILKVMAAYQYAPAVRHTVYALRKRIAPHHYLWPVIIAHYAETGHPNALALIEEMREPLPSGSPGVALLRLANVLADRGELPDHPFASDEGRQLLKRWITDTDPFQWHDASEATIALAFLNPSARDTLLSLNKRHPDPRVRLDGIGITSIDQPDLAMKPLLDHAKDPRYSKRACRHLRRLGQAAAIPDTVKDPGFQALVRLSRTLEAMERFASPPDLLQVIHAQECHWPPLHGPSACWLCRFIYRGSSPNRKIKGMALVTTSATVYLDEPINHLDQDDLYAFFCAYESDSDTSDSVSALIARGRELLKIPSL
jgi:hypothetical protein